MLCATSHLERVPHRAVYGRRQHPHEHARPTTDGARRKTSTHRRKRETKDRKQHEARESDRSATASQGTRQAGGGRRKRKREGKSHRDRKHLHQAQRPSTPYARAKKQNNLENHTYMLLPTDLSTDCSTSCWTGTPPRLSASFILRSTAALSRAGSNFSSGVGGSRAQACAAHGEGVVSPPNLERE